MRRRGAETIHGIQGTQETGYILKVQESVSGVGRIGQVVRIGRIGPVILRVPTGMRPKAQ